MSRTKHSVLYALKCVAIVCTVRVCVCLFSQCGAVSAFPSMELVSRLVDLCMCPSPCRHHASIRCLCFQSTLFFSLFPFSLVPRNFFPLLDMCVQFVMQTIGRKMILLNRLNKSCEWSKPTNAKKLLRESRLTWKNSSRNISIEICVNGCECECVQPTKIIACSVSNHLKPTAATCGLSNCAPQLFKLCTGVRANHFLSWHFMPTLLALWFASHYLDLLSNWSQMAVNGEKKHKHHWIDVLLSTGFTGRVVAVVRLPKFLPLSVICLIFCACKNACHTTELHTPKHGSIFNAIEIALHWVKCGHVNIWIRCVFCVLLCVFGLQICRFSFILFSSNGNILMKSSSKEGGENIL